MKIDISSTVLEKGIDLAKSFLDKLITPSIEEVGILFKEKVTFWRFKNQIQIVNKARAYCEIHNISTKEISLKLLCPILEYASLEEDQDLQGKWATLLANMVDSEQNIQNHVFPYLLSQISKNEFEALDNTLIAKQQRIIKLRNELENFNQLKPAKVKAIKADIQDLKAKNQDWVTINEIRKLEGDLYRLDIEENKIQREILEPEVFLEDLKEFELSNLSRLAILKPITQHYAYAEPIKIPERNQYFDNPDIDIKVGIESEGDYYILTELGEMFLIACSEKAIKN